MQKDEIIELGKSVLHMESSSVLAVAERLGDSFYGAFLDIYKCKGRVILAGVGKSGQIGQKIASTMSSTGTPSFFVHPSEALHGDFGMMTPQDCLIAISYGGETREILALAKYAKDMGMPVIAITGKTQSTLGKFARHAIDAEVLKEADTLGLAPTSSSTAALALGDALAVVTMHAKGMTRERFATLHPGGTLGRELAQIEDFMRPMDDVCILDEMDRFELIVDGMNRSNFGIAAVVNSEGRLMGCISDGDLRRALLQHGSKVFTMKASGVMSPKPKIVYPQTRAIEAISLMEEYKITSLFVVKDTDSRQVKGLARLHDLLSAKII
jgi:arabinose-5-phosphate isomerase